MTSICNGIHKAAIEFPVFTAFIRLSDVDESGVIVCKEETETGTMDAVADASLNAGQSPEYKKYLTFFRYGC